VGKIGSLFFHPLSDYVLVDLMGIIIKLEGLPKPREKETKI
jgi:hypothetical protein